jgi:phospholipid/cholesterol/gamma-HCH transport system permease protein
MRGTRAAADRFLHACTTTMVSASRADEHRPRVELARPVPGALHVQMFGVWRIGESVPPATALRHDLDESSSLDFDTSQVVEWDSVLVSYAARVVEMARTAEVAVDRTGLPSGVQRLLALAQATPRKDGAPPTTRPSWIARFGARGIEQGRGFVQIVGWAGELTISIARLLIGRAKFRTSDLFLQMQLTGARALGIVSLVAALVGLILAYVGAVQLEQFGAAIYVADLVGIAMVRDMGAMMAAIVVAGRTGAAFAAELGTMRVTQEIDALSTLSIRPVEFLVLPRVLAVTLMMPLLCVYADVVGLAGGAVVGILVLHIPPRLYLDQTLGALSIGDLLGGIVKAGTYGFLIGAAACYEGLRSGRTAAAVGKAATSAVVDGIVLVIAACGVFAVLFHRLGI